MKNLDLSTILASAIHESKNQVGTLLYKLQSLKDTLPQSDQNQSKIVTIEESLKKLNDEWVEYLYLYKLASNGYELHFDTFLMDEFLDDQTFALQPSANAKALELEYQCDPKLIGSFDERLMTAVVSTAVYNAIRFAKSKIILNASLENDYLIIAVDDDGQGFDTELLNQATDFDESNTGLGLYFSSLSANAHQLKNKVGYIERQQSQLLGGARLAVYLPQ